MYTYELNIHSNVGRHTGTQWNYMCAFAKSLQFTLRVNINRNYVIWVFGLQMKKKENNNIGLSVLLKIATVVNGTRNISIAIN